MLFEAGSISDGFGKPKDGKSNSSLKRINAEMDAKPMMDIALLPSIDAIDIGLGSSEKGNVGPAGKPKKKSMTSFYLKFFETAPDGKSRRCKFCKQNYSIATATGNLGRHLSHRHPGYDRQGDFVPQAPQAIPFNKKPSQPNVKSTNSVDNDHLSWLLLKWVINGPLPFSTFEDEGLADSFKFINSSTRFWSKARAHSVLLEVFRSMREDVKAALDHVNCKVSITLDYWTNYEQVPYMSITGHWIDENWSLRKVLLDITHIPYPHGGTEIYHSMLKVLESYNISGRVLACTHDNNQNVIIACRMLKDYLDGMKEPFTYIQCAAQTLNLIMEDGLRYVKPAIAKIRECVLEMNTSVEIAQDFREMASACQEGSWNFPLDVSTRPSGHYTMLDVATKANTAMDAVIMKHEKMLGRNRMTTMEKNAVEKTRRYLDSFFKTTNNLCGSELPTIGLVFFFMDHIMEMIKSCRESRYDPDWLKGAAVDMANKALIYSNQVYNLYTFISAILDPRIKKEFVPVDLNTDLNQEAARNHFMMNYASGHFSSIPNGYTNPQDRDGGVQNVSFAEEIARKRRRVSMNNATDELTQYLSEPPAPLSNTDVLDWWRGNSARFPKLSAMARDYLAVQSTAVPPDLVFSAAGDAVEKQRTSLSHDSVQAVMCIRSWVQNGFKFKFRSNEIDYEKLVEPVVQDAPLFDRKTK
ncbi:uncharacterized protein LOC18439527 isoform X1 [Amborella trichopoda]|nr:uncharacterized protein LOC18439527 isoform X1 [Amborella trichopoda]|eukprot:XP_011625335.1 uncharacterized protein LOC18439527 isoform X1 [Amborella trichopoda]